VRVGEEARALLVVVAIAALAARGDVGGPAAVVGIALALWLAFPVVLLTGSVVHENVAWQVAAVHAGDWLLKLLLITGIVTLWR
jgi:hypothetical protein